MNHYHFYWQEQNQIFLASRDWLASYFDMPGWAACMLGEFLTQFYYYQWAGVAILSATAIGTLALLYACLRRELPRWGVWTIMAIAALWIAACCLNINYRLAQLLSLAGGIALAIPAKKLGWWGLIAIPLAYWMLGYGAIATCLIYGCKYWRSILKPAAAVAILAICPLAYALPYSYALTYPGIGKPYFTADINEDLLAIDNEFYFGNYDKAEKIALETAEPNAVTAFYYYLSKAKKDSLPEYLLEYPVKDLGTLNQIGENTPMPIINMMNDLYYELGDMMYAERAAMMRNVFSGRNRNVRMVKRLAEANLVSGDTVAAMKYLRILSKTFAYRQWAENRMPGKMHPAIEARILDKRQYTNQMDNLRLGDNCRNILLELLESNPDNTMALDYLLCTDLLRKQMDTFKMDYDRYCMQEGRPRLRKLYQEALMVYLAGTDAPQEEWQRYIALPEILHRFSQYNRQRRSPAFADTYWYYFDLPNEEPQRGDIL